MSEVNPRVRVAVILLKGDTVLLIEHLKGGEYSWLVPGGGVDENESLEDAVKRELREELNLDIEVGDVVMLNDTIAPDGSRHVVNIYFAGEIIGGNIVLGDDPRLSGYRFVPIDEVPTLEMYPDIAEELAAGLKDGFSGRAQYLGARWKN